MLVFARGAMLVPGRGAPQGFGRGVRATDRGVTWGFGCGATVATGRDSTLMSGRGPRRGSGRGVAWGAVRDVIVRFDGIRVDNIYDYTFALRSRKPGQNVRITVKRGDFDSPFH